MAPLSFSVKVLGTSMICHMHLTFKIKMEGMHIYTNIIYVIRILSYHKFVLQLYHLVNVNYYINKTHFNVLYSTGGCQAGVVTLFPAKE